MKPPQFYTTVTLSIIVLILTITLMVSGQNNQKLQEKLQQQQATINQGMTFQQIGTNMLKDIATASLKSEKLKEVLTRSGYTVNVNPGPGTTGTSGTSATSSSTSPTP